MKTLALTLLGLCAIPWTTTPQQDSASAASVWKEALTSELSYAPLAPPDQAQPGAPGAHALAFWIGGTHAGAIVDRIEGAGVGVFIGVAADPKVENAVAKGIRVRFKDASGKTHDVPHHAFASGAVAMLFRSPEGLPAHEIVGFQVLYDASAKWAEPR